MTWVHIQSEDRCWTVGHYNRLGLWQPESDHSSREEAARRVNYLNGGNGKLYLGNPGNPGVKK